MISKEQTNDLMTGKAVVVDSDGQKIGKIEQIFLDDRTGEPAWTTVSMGLFGSSETFIPLDRAEKSEDQVQVPYSKDFAKDAPRVDAGGHLDPQQEQELYRYYEMSDQGQQGNRAGGAGGGAAGGAAAGAAGGAAGDRHNDNRSAGGPGHDTSGPNTDEAMTRSEEELHVGTQQHETGKVRLRKYVVTENVETTVPVSREEVRVEREPITDADRDKAASGPAISEEEHEVTLHAEEPVVSKEAKPVERVRLNKETVTDEAEINEQVRKERIETDDDRSGRRR